MQYNIASIQSFGEATHHLFGFLFVLFTLTLLWIITELVGVYFKRFKTPKTEHDLSTVEPIPKPRPATIAGVPAPISTKSDDVSEEELAAITGCIMAIMGKNSRIVAVRSNSAQWGHEGRRDHFASHRIR